MLSDINDAVPDEFDDDNEEGGGNEDDDEEEEARALSGGKLGIRGCCD